MTKGYVPSSKPSDVKQDSKEQFETIGTSFQPKLNPFKSPIQMHADWCVKIFLKILLVIWPIFYRKQNNGNFNVLKQDSYYGLWLDYNNLSSSICSGNLFCVSDHIMWFSLP